MIEQSLHMQGWSPDCYIRVRVHLLLRRTPQPNAMGRRGQHSAAHSEVSQNPLLRTQREAGRDGDNIHETRVEMVPIKKSTELGYFSTV